jgi:hypothetical protein
MGAVPTIVQKHCFYKKFNYPTPEEILKLADAVYR